MREDRRVLFGKLLEDSDDAPLAYLKAVVKEVTRSLADRSKVLLSAKHLFL
jgi:hypothetical protein